MTDTGATGGGGQIVWAVVWPDDEIVKRHPNLCIFATRKEARTFIYNSGYATLRIKRYAPQEAGR